MQRAWATCVLLALFAPALLAQAPALPAAPQAAAQGEPPKDPLGRSTPRGTLNGFLAAARKGDNALAHHYLEAALPDAQAERLAHQLFVVLDVRLPARLGPVSDAPTGSRLNPLEPDEEYIGTIAGADGPVDVVLRRVTKPKAEPIWLFSSATLDAVPVLYDDIVKSNRLTWVPRFAFRNRVLGLRLFDWVAVLLGLPILYLITVLLNRFLTPTALRVWRRAFPATSWAGRNALPAPARLLILAIASRWLFGVLPLSLLLRQALGNLAYLLLVCATTWLVFLVNGQIELGLHRRIPPANYSAAVSLLRVGRRVVDVVVVLIALLAILRHFGIDPTPVLAGLGVGGIAVALAAQKTLENIIAGASLIFDQAVRVGDYLKLGEIEGTVEHIGLRSTRLRTLGRSVVTVPNGQVANMVLETLSDRDKFWFRHLVGLRYETTADQMRAVLDGTRELLARHPLVESTSIRVRFLRLAAFSLDVEIFAYVKARDWAHFLEVQEQLLVAIRGIVARAGTDIAFPSQTMYMEGPGASLAGQR